MNPILKEAYALIALRKKIEELQSELNKRSSALFKAAEASRDPDYEELRNLMSRECSGCNSGTSDNHSCMI